MSEATFLLEHPLLNEMFDKLEHDAAEMGINAPFADDEMRRIAMGEVRAIRSVRRKLRLMAETIPGPVPVV